MKSAVRVHKGQYAMQGSVPAARDQEIGVHLAAASKSSQLTSKVAQNGMGRNAFHLTGSKPKPYARVRKQQVTEWKFPRLAFGSAILGVVLVGTLAAAHANDGPANSPGSTLTVPLPAAKPSSDVRVAGSSSSVEPEFISPAVIERARQRIRARVSVKGVASGSAQVERQLGGAPVDSRKQATSLAAKLPLPNHVVARTIERIGYACGDVASVVALEGGEPGEYKVTCTSGQSYQARPVHGRYHFRRW